MKCALILIWVLAILASATLAGEVDSFTDRYQPLRDSRVAINKKTNQLFQEALKRANRGSKGCLKKRLYSNLQKSFRIYVWGDFVSWLWETPDVERISTDIREGIYQDFSVLRAFSFSNIVISDLIHFDNHLVGVDKFEHFLGSGFRYFRAYYLEKKGLEATLNIGLSAENGSMGASTGGVKAFADLSANFNGMRFWNHVLQKEDDVLGGPYNIGPYVECRGNRWVQVKKVDWRSYVDASFDEGVNCSHFGSQEKLEFVLARITDLERQNGRSYTCPLEPQKLEGLTSKYGDLAPKIMNFEGHQVFRRED